MQRGTPAERARRRFLRFFPGGFVDEQYLAWERDYKWDAHTRWKALLAPAKLERLLRDGRDEDVATEALRIEGRTNLLFSFEKMALRDAVRTRSGATQFAHGLHAWLHGSGSEEERFTTWCEVVAKLPRRLTRVLTWPVVTVFGFIAQPTRHMFVKPNVTRLAAARYGFPLDYQSRPSWPTYRQVLDLARTVLHDQRDLRPRDLIDAQSFLWVQGSEEYQGRAFRALATTRVPRDLAADRG